MKLTRVNSRRTRGAELVALPSHERSHSAITKLTRVNFDGDRRIGDSAYRTGSVVRVIERINRTARINRMSPSPRSTVEIAETLGKSGGFCYLGALLPRCTDRHIERSKPASANH